MRTENGFIIEAWNQADVTSSATPTTALQMIPTANIVSITALTNIGNLCVATTASTAILFAGQNLLIQNTGDANFNGYVQIDTILSATQFAYRSPGIPTTAAVAATYSTYKVRTALIQADPANTAAVTFGPNTSANGRSLAANQEYVIPQVLTVNDFGAKFDLANWWFKSASASQVIHIFWISIMAMLFFLASDVHAQGGYVGVQQIVPGANITVSPVGGSGVVTISSSGGSGLSTNGVLGGTGITVSKTTTNVTVSVDSTVERAIGTYSITNATGSISATQLYTNASGAYVTGTLHVLPTVITNGTGTFTFTATWTNEVGANTFTPVSTVSTASTGPLSATPYDLTISNAASITFTTTVVGSAHYNLRSSLTSATSQ